MVATLLRLRFRVLGNQLSRSPWQLIGFIFGALYGVAVLFGAAIGLVFLPLAGLEIAAAVIVGVGSLVTIGWVVGPLIAFGVDTTLDPARLAIFPMSIGTMMVALTTAGVAGVPGIVTSVAALATLATWGHWPLSIVAALVAIPIAVLTAVVASRAMASLASGLGGRRRWREATGVLVFIPLILAGPIIAGLATGFTVNLDTATTVVGVLSWTPVGAAWALPAAVAGGDWAAAAAKLVIALATLALLWLLWRWSLAENLKSPRQHAATTVKPGRIGWFGRVPSTPTGAVLARALTSWTRDPRYLRQLIVVPLFPVLLWFSAQGTDPWPIVVWSAPLIALVVGIVPYTDISYDGTAFGTQLATPASGRADRAGRTLAAASVAAPLVVLAAVVPFAFSGEWSQLPGILGMSLGILFTSLGVCAVTSALLVVPVAASGDNPFKRVPGTTFLQGLAFMGIWLIAIVLSLPSAIPTLVAFFTGDPVLSWVAGAIGIVVGGVVVTVGIHVGGRTLDRTGPVLLSRLKAMKNA